jgi:hypothetical protein
LSEKVAQIGNNKMKIIPGMNEMLPFDPEDLERRRRNTTHRRRPLPSAKPAIAAAPVNMGRYREYSPVQSSDGL